MNTTKALEILEALASGCSPATGEAIANDNILNDRDVIRALQLAIDYLRQETTNNHLTKKVELAEKDVENIIQLFEEEARNPSASNLTAFALATKQFKNNRLINHAFYGKFKGAYTRGQMIDFFSNYLAKKPFISKKNIREEAYQQIDFFEKSSFNFLTENGIKQLKEKINELGILKTENLSEQIIEARKTHARAYEQWSEKETELLTKALKYTNDLNLLSECFQRGQKSIESVGKKIIFSAQNTTNNI